LRGAIDTLRLSSLASRARGTVTGGGQPLEMEVVAALES
jgi:hypothetical protein